jgi:hypothetical protein
MALGAKNVLDPHSPSTVQSEPRAPNLAIHYISTVQGRYMMHLHFGDNI